MASVAPQAVAAVVAGAATALAYVDAKYHLSKDIKSNRQIAAAAALSAAKAKANRNSLWYDFEAQVHRLPAHEQCLWSRNGNYTWRETHANACRYAQALLELGVTPGTLIATYLNNSPEFVFSLLGSWSIGSAPALINCNLAGQSLVHCLRISGAKLLVVDSDSDCLQRIQEARDTLEQELGIKIVVLDEATKNAINAFEPKRPERKYRENVTPEFPAGLMYTSGSTGLPKCCPFQTGRAFVLQGPRIKACGMKPGPDGDRWYDCMPLYHGTGFTTSVCCLTTGVTLCIGRKFSTSGFWQDIRDSDATGMVYVGETVRYLLTPPPSPLDRQHRVKVAFGNGLRPDVWARFTERFGIETVIEIFNSTEGVLALQNECRGEFQRGAVGHQGAINRSKTHDILIPVETDYETGKMYRDPKTGFARRKPYEEGGEILVRVASEKVFAGYWNNPEATAQMFERNVFKKGDLFYRSGDALRRTPDGLWYFMDRLGDTYRWKSENVSTAEVSQVLGRLSGVVEAIVYGVEVPGHDGRAGCAALNIEPSQRGNAAFYTTLLAHARKALPKYAVPIFIRVIADLKPMHNNKQNKAPLKKEGIDLAKIASGEGGRDDRLLWLPEALGVKGRGEGYVAFEPSDLEALRSVARAQTGGAGPVAARL
ncbi:hypothetical protein IWX50DRAFT_474428 [Phyllosticta citricarpa]